MTLTAGSHVVGWTVGDAAMLSVVEVSRRSTDAKSLAYLASVAVVAIASFLLFGLPQIYAWRATPSVRHAPALRFGRMNARIGTVFGFLALSLVDGPLGVGAVTGRSGNRRAVELTALSALLMAAVWCAGYLWLGFFLLAPVLCGVTGFALLATLGARRGNNSNGAKQ